MRRGEHEGTALGFTPATATAVPALLDRAPTDATAFVAARDLTAYVLETERLLVATFPRESHLSLQVETDPEADGTWLVFDVGARCGADDAPRAYERFVGEWIASVPPHARESMRVTFNLS
jgi:hypothetical protein